jgi:hypothetical protein
MSEALLDRNTRMVSRHSHMCSGICMPLTEGIRAEKHMVSL